MHSVVDQEMMSPWDGFPVEVNASSSIQCFAGKASSL